MASINYAAREISVKIVYYGPGLSGKTTNLQVIHRKIPAENRSDMVSLATETDRTLFFDFLPIDLGKIKGFSTKFQLYTVPGQVYYNATRKLVLRGVDGVVFVADSAPDKIDENLESFQNLEENLAEYGYKRESIPIVIQYNKRDLPNALSIDELNAQINKYNLPYGEAVAAKGKGVFESLKQIGKHVLDFLNKKYDRQGSAPRRPAPAPAVAPAPAAVVPPAQSVPAFSSDSYQASSPQESPWAQPPAQQAYPQTQRQTAPETPRSAFGSTSPFEMQQPGAATTAPQNSSSDPFEYNPSRPSQSPVVATQDDTPSFEMPPTRSPAATLSPEKPVADYGQFGSIKIERPGADFLSAPQGGTFDAEIAQYQQEFDRPAVTGNQGGFNPQQMPQPNQGQYQGQQFQQPPQQQQYHQPQQQQFQHPQQAQQFQQPVQQHYQGQQFQQPQQQFQGQQFQQQFQGQQFQQPQQQYQAQQFQQQQQGVNQSDYSVYNVEPPAFQGSPTRQQPAIQSGQPQQQGGAAPDDTMYFTSVNTDARKKPKKPVNPTVSAKQGLFGRLFNRNQPE